MKFAFTVVTAFSAIALAGSAFAGSAEDIIAKEKCNKCHTEKTTKKAPSWASIAEKYKGNPDAANKIFTELKSGGKIGDEEDHKKIVASDADIKAIAAIVLSSK
jgi:cytochrome c551/c552